MRAQHAVGFRVMEAAANDSASDYHSLTGGGLGIGDLFPALLALAMCACSSLALLRGLALVAKRGGGLLKQRLCQY